jgi:hypothetical protein
MAPFSQSHYRREVVSMPIQRFALVLAAALLAGGAHAELKGTYQLHDGKQLDLYYRDDQHMRASVGDDKQLVLKGAETWVLKRQDGQWLALNVNGMGGLLRAFAKPATDAASNAAPVQLRDLGRQETVAGYSGEVYELSSGDKKYEVVLSDHPDVLALTNGWRHMALKIAENLGQKDAQRLQQALDAIPSKGRGGLLRQGDNLKLVAIDKNAKSTDVELPPDTKIMTLPQLSLPGGS